MTDHNLSSADPSAEQGAQPVILKEWPAVLRPKLAAAYIGIPSPRIYDLYRTDPTFPRQIRYSRRCVGWRRASLDAWLEAKEGAAEVTA